jgi:iron complex transport system permease protein
VATTPGEVWDALVGGRDDLLGEVVRRDRLPPVLLGFLAGAALAVSGAVLQALLRNGLAEPYLIGVGPGAVLGVTAAALLAGSATTSLFAFPAARAALAFLGAAGAAALAFAAAGRGGRFGAASLVLSGTAVGAFVSAVAMGALYMASDDWHLVVLWLLGHLAPAEPGEILLLLGALLAGGAVALSRARDLDALALGDEPAGFLGVDARRATLLLAAVACLLAAAAVAVAGLVGFVGLVVPHLARGIVGPGHLRLLPAAALLGGALLALSDALARTLEPAVPVGVVTAFLGAPFLAVLVRRRGDS